MSSAAVHVMSKQIQKSDIYMYLLPEIPVRLVSPISHYYVWNDSRGERDSEWNDPDSKKTNVVSKVSAFKKRRTFVIAKILSFKYSIV